MMRRSDTGDAFALDVSRIGDALLTRLADGATVYFQTGDDGSEVLDLAESGITADALGAMYQSAFERAAA